MAKLFKSIRARLTLAFIVIAISPILIAGVLMSSKSFSALKNEAYIHQKIEAERVGLAVQDYVRELERVLELTSKAHDFISLGQQDQQNILEELLSFENRFEELFLLDSNGKQRAHCDRIHVVAGIPFQDRSGDRVFQEVLKNKTNYFSPVRFHPETGEPQLTLGIPLQSLATGKIRYVLLASIRLKKIWDLLSSISKEHQTVFIIDEHGNIVGHPDPSVALSGKKFLPTDLLPGIASGLDGEKAVMAAKKVSFGEHSLIIIAQKNVSEAMALASSIVTISILVIVCALAVAIFLASLVIGNIVSPLQRLSSAARSIEDGDLDQQVEYLEDDELGKLGQAFNAMTGELRSKIEELQSEIIQRKKMEDSLREGEERFRLIMDSVDALIYVADMESYELLFINKFGREIFGDVAGQTCWQVMQKDKTEPCDFCTNDKLLDAEGRPSGIYVWEIRNTKANQWFECRDQAVLWPNGQFVRLEIATDITRKKAAEEEREELEEQLRQAHKIEAIGTLAGGIAHDFNNILTVISGYNELAKMHLNEPKLLAEDLEEAHKGTLRARDLVAQILAFSRKADQEAKPLQISVILKEALKMLRASIPTTIEIKQQISSSSMVMADPTQIHQIIMNLCTNAYHSMRETGGTIAVALTDVEIDSNEYKYTGLKKGQYLKLEVSDTGSGIEKEILDKIFEPYFTTKKQGEGTGMGLAVVHGIVKSHHGHISVYSEPDKGTSFHLYFPVKDRTKPYVPEKEETQVVSTGGKGEHILVVEDEEQIRKIIKNFLSYDGYNVFLYSNGVEALENFKEEADNYDLVITDMTMPYITGAELAQKILEIRPNIPIILCTGQSELINREKALAMGIREYLNKPLSKKTLLETTRRVLDTSQGNP